MYWMYVDPFLTLSNATSNRLLEIDVVRYGSTSNRTADIDRSLTYFRMVHVDDIRLHRSKTSWPCFSFTYFHSGFSCNKWWPTKCMHNKTLAIPLLNAVNSATGRKICRPWYWNLWNILLGTAQWKSSTPSNVFAPVSVGKGNPLLLLLERNAMRGKLFLATPSRLHDVIVLYLYPCIVELAIAVLLTYLQSRLP